MKNYFGLPLDKVLQRCYAFRVMKFWSVEEASRELGISGQRVRFLLKDRRLKGKKMGNTWIVLSLDYNKKPPWRPRGKQNTEKGGTHK